METEKDACRELGVRCCQIFLIPKARSFPSLALELGKTAQTAPDAWCYLRESVVKGGKQVRTVKDFERWLYQRDGDGARTQATEKVEVPPQMFEFDRAHLYDMTARQTQVSNGQSSIRFGVDETFLAGGPHPVAVKITYLDRANAEWQLEYFTGDQKTTKRPVTCGDSGTVRTVTFILNDACFPGEGYTGLDLQIRALRGDAIIRMVRVIKLTPPGVQ